jgi:hypothetical protein
MWTEVYTRSGVNVAQVFSAAFHLSSRTADASMYQYFTQGPSFPGLPDINIEDLKANTEYHKYSVTSLQIVW